MAPNRFAGAPMWTNENRSLYDRSKHRYPSDLTDEEWALIEPLIPPAKRGGGLIADIAGRPGDDDDFTGERSRHAGEPMVFTCRYSSNPSTPISRPMPLCL